MFNKKQRNRLYVMLIMDFFSSPWVQIQVPKPLARWVLLTTWQMRPLHIVFPGKEWLLHWQGSKTFQSLKWVCEPSCLVEAHFSHFFLGLWGRTGNGLWKVLYTVRGEKTPFYPWGKKFLFHLKKPCTWGHRNRVCNWGFNSVCQCTWETELFCSMEGKESLV